MAENFNLTLFNQLLIAYVNYSTQDIDLAVCWAQWCAGDFQAVAACTFDLD